MFIFLYVTGNYIKASNFIEQYMV